MAAATNHKSMLWRAGMAGGKQVCCWQRGGRGQPQRCCRCREESLCSANAPLSQENCGHSVLVLHHSVLVLHRSVLVLHRSVTLPSRCKLEPVARGCSGWRGTVGKGCVTPAKLCNMRSLAFSCLQPASRAAFPFGFGSRLLMPRQQGEDLALVGV